MKKVLFILFASILAFNVEAQTAQPAAIKYSIAPKSCVFDTATIMTVVANENLSTNIISATVTLLEVERYQEKPIARIILSFLKSDFTGTRTIDKVIDKIKLKYGITTIAIIP